MTTISLAAIFSGPKQKLEICGEPRHNAFHFVRPLINPAFGTGQNNGI